MTFELGPGTVLGRYELLAPVAKGGMAQVWLARLHGSRGFHKFVAVKTILTKTSHELRSEAMLLEEARVAALIHHPNIVTTLDLGEEKGVLYLVMEWVHGETLRDVFHKALTSGGIPLPLSVNVIAQACKGLHAAHEVTNASGSPLHLVHRDISPQNVLLSYSGVVKVADFGIAKAKIATAEVTQPGELKGKVAFMSPEQLNCEPLDRRSDVFAMGTLLYLVTTGHHPFRGPNTVKTFSNIIACNPPRPSAITRHYPADLEQVVLKALAAKPAQRWQTAAEMFAALLDTQDGSRGHFESAVADYMRQVMGDHERERMDLIRRCHDTSPASPSSASLSPNPDRVTSPRVTVAAFHRDSQPPPAESIGPAVMSLHGGVTEDGASSSASASFKGWRHRGVWLAALMMGGALLLGLTAREMGMRSPTNATSRSSLAPVETLASARDNVALPASESSRVEQPSEASLTEARPTALRDVGALRDAPALRDVGALRGVDVPRNSPAPSRRKRDAAQSPSDAPAAAASSAVVRSVNAWDRRQFGGRN